MNHIELSKQYFAQNFNCAQAVFTAFADELGLSEKQALKIGGCFGSGMRKGEVCGACTGALMALGLKYGQSEVDDIESKQKTNEVTERFLNLFKKENGSYICKELLGCDISTYDGRQFALENNLFVEFCPKMVESATIIAEKLLKADNSNLF